MNGSAAKFLNSAGTGLSSVARRALKRLWLKCPHKDKPHLKRQIMKAAKERASNPDLQWPPPRVPTSLSPCGPAPEPEAEPPALPGTEALPGQPAPIPEPA